MRKLQLGLTIAVFAFTAIVGAQTYNPTNSRLSALKQNDNLASSGGALFEMTVNRQASDPDLYINNAIFNAGTNWDSNIVNNPFASSGFLGSYELGTALTGEGGFTMSLDFIDLVPNSVVNGLYDFSYDIIGGGSSSASDLLATLEFQVDVRTDFRPTYTLNFDRPSITAGETANLDSVLNNTLAESIYVNGLYYFFGAGLTPNVMDVSFDFNFFAGELTSGSTSNSVHSDHTARADTPLGIYGFNGGFYGGYYQADQHWVKSANSPTIEVVPEPATMIALAGGIALLARRRKS